MIQKPKDLLNGDHSFKMWWTIMATNNSYVYIFIAAFVALICELVKNQGIFAVISAGFADSILGGILTSVGCAIPAIVFVAVGIEMVIYWKQLRTPII